MCTELCYLLVPTMPQALLWLPPWLVFPQSYVFLPFSWCWCDFCFTCKLRICSEIFLSLTSYTLFYISTKTDIMHRPPLIYERKDRNPELLLWGLLHNWIMLHTVILTQCLWDGYISMPTVIRGCYFDNNYRIATVSMVLPEVCQPVADE